jgi:1-acyl-sn-glycerol-3-phosphate acyltransferase
LFARFILWLAKIPYHIRIEGEENIPSQGPVILINNHASGLDFLVVCVWRIKRPDLHPLVADAIMSNPFIAKLFTKGGGIPLYKAKDLSIPSLLAALRCLKRGESVCLGPEGEMSWDGELQKFKPGAAWLALKSGAPICPTLVRGVYDIWPRWATYPRLNGKIEIIIGKPFSIHPLEENDRLDDSLIQEYNQRIVDELCALKGK